MPIKSDAGQEGCLTTGISFYSNDVSSLLGLTIGDSINSKPLSIKDVTVEYKKRFVTTVDFSQRNDKGNYKATKIPIEEPNKVIVTFNDGKQQFAVCDASDTFNLEMGITICLCKHLLTRPYFKEEENSTKVYNRIIREGIKIYKNKLKEEKKKKQEEEARKAREAAKQRKRINRAAKKKEREIEIIAEAIRRVITTT